MRKKFRRGFSLLELIVAFALLAIVSGMLVGFVTSSTGAYRSVSTEVGLQYQAQVIQSQMEAYVIDCNGGVVFEGDSLYLVNDVTESGAVIHMFRYDSGAGTLYYGENDLTREVSGGIVNLDYDTDADDFLAEHVTGFSVTLTEDSGGVTAAQVDLSLSEGGRDYAARQVIALRNKPQTRDSLSALLTALTAID